MGTNNNGRLPKLILAPRLAFPVQKHPSISIDLSLLIIQVRPIGSGSGEMPVTCKRACSLRLPSLASLFRSPQPIVFSYIAILKEKKTVTKGLGCKGYVGPKELDPFPPFSLQAKSCCRQ